MSQSSAAARGPAAAWDGSGFLIVWSDERKGNGDLYATKIGADGKKSSEWVLVEGAEDSKSPAIVKLSTGFLVAWFDATPIGADVKTIVLGADGKATGMPTMLSPTTSKNPRPIATSAFGGAAVAWSDMKGSIPSAQVAWLNSSGQLTIPAVTLGTATGGAEFPAVAASDDMLAVFYSDGRDGNHNIRATLFNDQLVSQKDVAVREAAGNAVNSRATWNGKEFVAAWEDLASQEANEEVHASRLAPNGTATSPVVVPEVSEEANWPALASTPQGVAIAYYQRRGGNPFQIIVSYMDKNGELVRPDLQVSNGRARFPAIAHDGSSLLGVAWEDTRSGTQEIYFARIQCP